LKILTAIDRLTIDNDAFEIKIPNRTAVRQCSQRSIVVASPLFSFQRTDAPRGGFSNLPQRAVTVNPARQNRNEL